MNESDLQLYPFVEDTKKPIVIPFQDDLLFHFFNKDTEISDNYLLDPVSGLKLYPKQSNCIRATALSTGFSIANAEIDLITEIESFFHHKIADVLSGYLLAGENVSSPYATSGLYLNAPKNAYYWYWKGASYCVINTSALTDDNWYISNCYVAATLSMKMRKVTIVNNALVVGNDINSTTTAKGTETLTSDFGILSGKVGANHVFSSKHKIGYVKIYGAGRVLMHHFVFSEGAESQVFDVVTGNSYTISNATLPNLWTNKQDFNHYNFKNGFTLYQKKASPDLRIPNKTDGSEPIVVSIPSGYTRIANYKECKKTFNQCESLFCLDNVDMTERLTVLDAPNSSIIGIVMPYKEEYAGKAWYESTSPFLGAYYYGDRYYIRENYSVQLYISEATAGDIEDPDLIWLDEATSEVVTIELQKTGGASDLYNADIDHVLFTESTGVAKNIDLKALIVEEGKDRGYLYYNYVDYKNFMLYKTDKTELSDVKILKYIGIGNLISYDEETKLPNYDENNHCELAEV